MNYEEAMIYLEGTNRFGSRLGLERMQVLLSYLDSPAQGIPTIHVAGTNGKGSTCAYSAYMLASAGLRVGLYCSPYVYDFGERIRVLDGRDPGAAWSRDFTDGQISPEAIAATLTEIKEAIEVNGMTGEAHPTHFEMLTVMAFLHFRDRDCDVMVLETGMGGRLDSTNVIPAPKVAVITAIGLDHQNRLGNTLTEIAGEKAGILKEGTEVLCLYDQSRSQTDPSVTAEIAAVFTERAAELGIRTVEPKKEDLQILSRDLDGQSFRYRPLGDIIFRTTLLPDYEPDNAALAIEAVRALHPAISTEELQQGISLCYWPARLEKMAERPPFLLDGGHNPQGAAALRRSLDLLFEEKTQEIHICSIMRDKDQAEMFGRVLASQRVKKIYCTTPQDAHRAEDPETLAAVARSVGTAALAVETTESVDEAVERALAECDNDCVVVAWGTFYQAGEVRDALRKRNV